MPTITTSVPLTNEQNQLALAVNEFGYELILKLMRKNENKNVVLSPTGIAGKVFLCSHGD